MPRGARLAALLGLDLNPKSGRSRRAIEVYPHAATVALFRLGRTLKYKNKPGRTFELLRDELLRADGPPRGRSAPRRPRCGSRGPAWLALRAQVESATRKSELRVVEDQVDAVLCAYVALFAVREPARTTTYGDFEAGYIVTPDAARGPPADAARAEPGRRGPGRRARAGTTGRGRPGVRRPPPGAARGQRAVRRAGHHDPRRRRHQLPERHRAGEERGVVRGEGGPRRRRRPRLPRPAARDHRPDRAAGDHLRAQRRRGGGRAARRPGGGARRPRPGAGDRERGPVRLRQPAPADRAGRRPRGPAGVRAPAGLARAGADPHRAAARLGGVRARHPLQGRDPRRARPRLRPPLHAGGRAARARRPGVLHDPRPAPGRR